MNVIIIIINAFLFDIQNEAMWYKQIPDNYYVYRTCINYFFFHSFYWKSIYFICPWVFSSQKHFTVYTNYILPLARLQYGINLFLFWTCVYANLCKLIKWKWQCNDPICIATWMNVHIFRTAKYIFISTEEWGMAQIEMRTHRKTDTHTHIYINTNGCRIGK